VSVAVVDEISNYAHHYTINGEDSDYWQKREVEEEFNRV